VSDARLHIQPRRVVGRRDPMIYGQFIEHFHRQVYGGIYQPGSPLADERGFRRDVLDALRRIRTPIIRWPGGCFASAYHWNDGIGPLREPRFDKAWRVEEPNTFGTDEFVAFCRAVGCEPYICANAGTGGPEEMADWVEYCNLEREGRWARLRAANGHREPYGVRYWSIGNENYLPGEIGAKTPAEWGLFVREAGKMMKRVDPTIQLLAASTDNLDWNVGLLREAGRLLDWVSLHGYWDGLWQVNDLSSYETCMAWSMEIEAPIRKMESILGALGMSGKVRIAYDEWNLRGWHHPDVDAPGRDCWTPRDKNDLNGSYTMADAVFSACFLNRCLAHCSTVGMANFAPAVNARGAIYAHDGGIVKRTTYHVFDLYVNHLGETVVDSWTEGGGTFEAEARGKTHVVPELDAAATLFEADGSLRVALVNRSPDRAAALELEVDDSGFQGAATLRTLRAESKDSYNDASHPDSASIHAAAAGKIRSGNRSVELPPHSVSVLTLER
jgi:alpha-N-arabinofuranosidase